MNDLRRAKNAFRDAAHRYRNSDATMEETYYPPLADLLNAILKERGLPFEVRTATTQRRSAEGGADHPDLAFYDDETVVLLGEVKLPDADVRDLAFSTDRNDQIGRYLAQTGVVLLTTVRSFGLLACRPGYVRQEGVPFPPEMRDLLAVVDLWASDAALARGAAVDDAAVEALADLVERAVTEFAPVATPAALARILAKQARNAKADLPTAFDTVAPLLNDYKEALGLTFDLDSDEGKEFFRSSLVQTAFYGLFAGWTIWHRTRDGQPFAWDRMGDYLKIPFLGQLFYEFGHPARLRELQLKRHLDRAAATLARVDRDAFFAQFTYMGLPPDEEPAKREDGPPALAAITYFYEPFLEAFDPKLREDMGVWYTPPEIVSYQVRRIEQLLKTELGCTRGFADERVVVLDPCCGTGAYLMEVVRRVAVELVRRGERDELGMKLLDALSRRILGFEILTAPFVVAQLQLYLLLSDLGAEPTPAHRPAVFLTNALTGWEGPDPVKLLFPELEEEHERAAAVKRGAKIVVILGNPPYNRFTGAAMAEEADLVDHYKGLVRDGKKVRSRLYDVWGVKKHLLNDLYIRFFRLAEQRIGEKAEYGVVSLISNYGYLTGRSHPIMRESILGSFHGIWIDALNGDKYKTGKVIPRGLPGEGTSDQSIFTTDYDPRGIQVGTAISTFLKRPAPPTPPGETPVHYRDFWGKGNAKRQALLESLGMDGWDDARRDEATRSPQGPRAYETFQPTKERRWLFTPREGNAGYEAWPSLEDLFPFKIQGVNPNRGMADSVLDADRVALERRMRAYFGAATFAEAAQAAPGLADEYAGFDPEKVWEHLKGSKGYDRDVIQPYLLFPFDLWHIYYEAEGKLLNRHRPEYAANLADNEFLVTVPQPRRVSESRPLYCRTLADLHLQERGSVCIPREVAMGGLLTERRANVPDVTWAALRQAWGLDGPLASPAAKEATRMLFLIALAILHAPRFQADHKEALAEDWARLPIPKARELAERIAEKGRVVAVLLDAQADAEPAIVGVLGDETPWKLGVLTKTGGGRVAAADMAVTYSYYGAATGKWGERAFREDEAPHLSWGERTGDLYLNPNVFMSNVPEAVWRFELGGYPVVKKWLGYRQANRRDGRPLTVAEKDHLRTIIQRLAALVALGDELDGLYDETTAAAFTAEELGI